MKGTIITGMNPKSSFGNRFRSKLRGIKPSASRDNSTSASNFTSFVFSESHYNLPIPLRLAFGIGVSTIRTALADRSPALYDTFILVLVTVVPASPIT
jgi:hypothetical protein